MTPRERVRRAVLFEGPDRVPRSLPEPWGSDLKMVGVGPNPDWQPAIEGEDEWGCVWAKLRKDETHGQCIGHPLDDYGKLETYRFPRFDLDARFENAARSVADNADEKFVLGFIPLSFIHRLEYLRGHVEAWTDPVEHPEQLNTLLTKLGDIAITCMNRMADLGADGIFSCDDWGLQDRPMVSPAVFREHFQPHYARVYQAARDRGLLCFLHSCGYIIDLIDPLIDAGLHVIQQDQQENMGVDALADRYGGRICFWCPVDIQKTMVEGTPEQIRDYARHMIERFGTYDGGFIAKWYPDPRAAGHSDEAIQAMCEAFVDGGEYPLATAT